MNNKTKLIFIILIFFSLINLAKASEVLWQEVHSKARGSTSPFNNSRVFILNEDKMQDLLAQSQFVRKGIEPPLITLPLPNGESVSVTATVTDVLPPLLAVKYPQIKTYQVINPQDGIIGGRLDFTPSGFHAMLQTDTGKTIYIDPVSIDATQLTNKRHYYSYQQQDQHPATPHQCELQQETSAQSPINFSSTSYQYAKKATNNTLLHRYRIAIAATGEYTRLQGGTVIAALSAITTTINRINQIYTRDLGIHFTLVNHNDEIIYTDAYSDPYSNGKSHLLILENQRTLNSVIGESNYDIGHVFGTSGGGLAIIDSLCSSDSKAKGTSGISNPNGENFYIDFVAHEIGHQVGATHTFNSNKGLCAGDTRTARTAFEPGSGSTIMAYTGICGSDNLQPSADAMFHIGSIEQIQKNIAKKSLSSCGSYSHNTNQAPVVNAGKDYIIPAGTPFTLQGVATDPENDDLSYSWQQIDTGTRSSVNTDRGDNALFRARLATSSAARTFPILTDILTQQRTNGETLPNTQRKLNFKLIAQDGHNNTSSDQVTLHIKDTGSRFALDLPYSHYTIGEYTDLTWNTANTEQEPINCTDINIYLSTDGGYTFNTLLAENIINNGKTSIYIPNTIPPSNKGRFKIACSNNIFFAISYTNFNLSYETSDHSLPTSPEPSLRFNSTPQTITIDNSSQANYEKMEAGSLNPILLFIFIMGLIIRVFN